MLQLTLDNLNVLPALKDCLYLLISSISGNTSPSRLLHVSLVLFLLQILQILPLWIFYPVCSISFSFFFTLEARCLVIPWGQGEGTLWERAMTKVSSVEVSPVLPIHLLNQVQCIEDKETNIWIKAIYWLYIVC